MGTESKLQTTMPRYNYHYDKLVLTIKQKLQLLTLDAGILISHSYNQYMYITEVIKRA